MVLLRVTFLIGILFQYQCVHTARILGIFPIPAVSHQAVFRALSLELARQGHEMVIVTPLPVTRENETIKNYQEIQFAVHSDQIIEIKKGERGVFQTSRGNTRKMLEVMYLFPKMIFENKEFQTLMADKSQHFDLIIVEALYHSLAALKVVFNAPVILLSSLGCISTVYETIGAPYIHPTIYPHVFSRRYHNLTFVERISNTYLSLMSWYHMTFNTWTMEEMIARKYINANLTIKSMKDSVDMVFSNLNPIFEGNRPLPPNVITLGALHLQPVKELPKDLKTIIDESQRGVIYVSLGTNVFVSHMDADLLNVFIEAFAMLPYDILWKADLNTANIVLPDNVILRKWFPQRDLLMHSNVKAFITQGGLQSTDEAIDAAIPMVGIPCLGDQWFNVETYVKHGIGVMVDGVTMTKSDLVDGVTEVIKNRTYKRNILKLRTLMRDQPQTPLERAVWWTEYVIRHRGAKHLRANSFNVSWTEYLMLEDVAKLFSMFLITVVFFSKIISHFYMH